MTITLRSVKGSALTTSELDGNFTDLDGRVNSLELTPPTPVEIANISISGSLMTVTLDDASFYTLAVPRASLRWRGEWAPSTAYSGYDFFSVDGDGIYLVLQAHTSDLTFVSTASDTDGDYYQRMLQSSDSGTIYDFGFGFEAAPAASDVLGRVRVARAITIPANFDGSYGGVVTDPDVDFVITVYDDGAEIGTITVLAGTDAGTQVWATTGGTGKGVAAGSVITFVAPDQGTDQEASIAGGSFVIAARLT